MPSDDINPIKRDDILEVYIDGASRNNPGKGAYAFIFVRNQEVLYKESGYLGDITNNQAEYKALINALDKVIEFSRWKVKVYSDSQLVVNHMSGVWRVKDSMIKALYREASKNEIGIKEIEYLHVPRTNKFIRICDELCNKCLNENTQVKGGDSDGMETN